MSYPHIVRKAAAQEAEGTFSHPWNPNSEISGAQLSRMAGLKRTGVSIGRLKPGKESFAYHLHHNEEEWVYILSGRGVAHIDGEDYALEPGARVTTSRNSDWDAFDDALAVVQFSKTLPSRTLGSFACSRHVGRVRCSCAYEPMKTIVRQPCHMS